jgi:biotin synthase
MTHKEGKCLANCGFCPQARESSSRADMLSRISWPLFPTANVLDKIQASFGDNSIKRVCIQALNYQRVFRHLHALACAIRKLVEVPISISCQPLNSNNMTLLASAGIERIGIPLDAATEALFDKIKGESAGGPYSWKRQFELLEEAVGIFGKGKVSTHLIVDLGETEQEMVRMIQKCVNIGVLPALFAFTPIPGTALDYRSPPPIQTYRRIQVARSLICRGIAGYENMRFDDEGRLTDFGVNRQTLIEILQTGEPFLTSGCPNCNRPYYNEKPSGPIYNYPRNLTEEDLSKIRGQIGFAGA